MEPQTTSCRTLGFQGTPIEKHCSRLVLIPGSDGPQQATNLTISFRIKKLNKMFYVGGGVKLLNEKNLVLLIIEGDSHQLPRPNLKLSIINFFFSTSQDFIFHSFISRAIYDSQTSHTSLSKQARDQGLTRLANSMAGTHRWGWLFIIIIIIIKPSCRWGLHQRHSL